MFRDECLSLRIKSSTVGLSLDIWLPLNKQNYLIKMLIIQNWPGKYVFYKSILGISLSIIDSPVHL